MTTADALPVPTPVTARRIAIAKLKPHPRNYRKHPADQLEHLAASIRDNGFYRNVVCARELTILAGHGTVEAAKLVGLTEVPVVTLDLDPLEPAALKVLAGDNEVMHLVESDDRALSEMLKEIAQAPDITLLGTGYDEAMLAALAMVTRPSSEIRDNDEAAEWAGMPGYAREHDPLALVIRFKDEHDRTEFGRRLGLTLTATMKSTWWPPVERDDVAALQIVG